MRNVINNFSLRSVAVGASTMVLAAFAGTAQSATSWTFDIAPSGSGTQYQCTQNGTTYGNDVSCYKDSTSYPGGLPTVKSTAWANTAQTSGAANNNTLEQGYLAVFASSTGADVGLGITNKDKDIDQGSTTAKDPGEGSSPEHAIDNNSTNSAGTQLTSINDAIYDMVLMEFSSAVTLTQITTSWVSTDSDMTIMACTSNAAACKGFSGKKYSQLASIGWDYIEHSGGSSTAGTRNINGSTGADNPTASSKTSQYWLIGAYNPTVGGAALCTTSTCVGNDAFKLLSVSAIVPNPPAPPGGSAPEPAGLALLGVAAAGAVTMRRRSVSRTR